MIEVTEDQINALLRLAESAPEALGDSGHDGRGHALLRRLPQPLIERCRALFQAGRRPAVVMISRGICTGCHVRLPTMLEQKAAHALALFTGPHCRRLLYNGALLGSAAAVARPSRRTAAARGAERRRQ
jgi:predicted  nucleic acid-binding Zn-ribbon protein